MARGRQGHSGKRLLGLEVVAANGGAVSLGRSRPRSVLKVALAWELAHAIAGTVVHDRLQPP